MTQRIDSGVQFNQATTRSHDAAPRGAEGQFRGQKVAKLDINSLIADAAEEMTFAASEKLEKKLSKRKIGRRSGLKSRAMQQAEAYLKKLPDNLKKEKLQQFVDRLNKQGATSHKQILQDVKGFFKEQSHQFAGLLYARKMLTEQGASKELLNAVQAALDDCLDELEPQVDAGLDLLTTTAGFSSMGRSEVQQLWEYYRNLVLKYDDLSGIHQSLSDKYSEDQFTEAISFLIKAVGQYLQSKDASIEPEELRHVIDDLYNLEVLGNLHRDAAGILEKMGSQFSLAVNTTALDMMSRILALKNEKWLRSDQVMRIVDDVGIHDIEAKIYILRELKNFVRLIPLKVYEDPENRTKFVDIFQETLDIAIDQEEEMLE